MTRAPHGPADRAGEFARLFPEVLPGGVLDAARLAELLGVPLASPRDGLSWPGRAQALAAATAPPVGVLVPDLAESVDLEHARNLCIEGDNLEVLKLLQLEHAGTVDLVYLDPPYNTGGRGFVYRDDFRHAGPRTDEQAWGRRHGGWLSMMLPRLILARTLLTPAGVIAISIDDNEVAPLRLLLDEVFGPQNFLDTFVWVNNLRGRQISGAGAAGTKEYLHVYARDIARAPAFRAPVALLKQLSPSTYKGLEYPIQHDETGPYVLKNELHNTNSAFNEQTRPNLVYDLYYDPATGTVRTADVADGHVFVEMVKIAPKPNNNGTHRFHAFRWSRAKVAAETHNLAFVEGPAGWKVFTKVRDVGQTAVKDLITDLSTGEGARDLADLGIPPGWFDYPKPARLVQLLVACATGPDSVVLDFFAGSNATAHGVALQNALDGGRRRMIAVQLPEPVPPHSPAARAGIGTVFDLTRLRARRLLDRFEQERRHGLAVYRLMPGSPATGLHPARENRIP